MEKRDRDVRVLSTITKLLCFLAASGEEKKEPTNESIPLLFRRHSFFSDFIKKKYTDEDTLLLHLHHPLTTTDPIQLLSDTHTTYSSPFIL